MDGPFSPGVALSLPLFMLFARVGIIDTHFGMILAYVAMNVPFTIWLIDGFFQEHLLPFVDAASTPWRWKRVNDVDLGISDAVLAQFQKAAEIRDSFGVQVELKVKISGESFITPPGELSDLVSKAVQAETGVTPELSTSGGTSDARFMKHHCPVVEFGLVGQSMHEVDENVEVAQIHQLKSIYTRILKDYFA